ncbi:Aldehyde dehydrogenase [Entophlyctis luteolus]|nr:Aldehyde dehydrogenase [Entophlyctis luteolus]
MPASHPEITASIASIRATFVSNKTKPLAWRRAQLKRLYALLSERESDLVNALQKDMKREYNQALFEITLTRNEVVEAVAHLDEWAATEYCKKSLITVTDTLEVRKEPLGVVLIIGAWNFPVSLLLGPLIPALAAGNCVILKADTHVLQQPSEVAPATEALLLELIPQYLDQSAVRVISGAVPETTFLLQQRFDHIFFTGSTAVGKIVMAAAAKTLTPVTLELGGKSPSYVHADADIAVTARRLVWVKLFNLGQVCTTADYVLVHKKVTAALVDAVKKAIVEMYTEDPKKSKDYGRIINKNHTSRLVKVITRQLALPHSKLEFGGQYDIDECYIAPTVISNVKITDPLMEDEIFGPLIGIIEVEDEDEAIRIIASRERPLTMFINTESSAIANKILGNTHSGTAMVNGYMAHHIVSDMPFGGIGFSGMGSYHGKAGFDTFTQKHGVHWRAKDFLSESINQLVYAPTANTPVVASIISWASSQKLESPVGWALRKLWPYATKAIALGVAFEVGRWAAGRRGGSVAAVFGWLGIANL